MVKLEQVALELLEYKVADIKAERSIRGGHSSAWDLFHFLYRDLTELSPDEKFRLEEAGRILKHYTGLSHHKRDALATFEDLVVESFSDILLTSSSPELIVDDTASFTDPAYAEEHQKLKQLAQAVWWQDIEGIIQQLAVRCRVERDRSTARLLYAILRNFERYQHSDTMSDLNLAQFKVVEPLIDQGNPLVSLNNIDSLTELVREVISIIMSIGQQEDYYADLDVPRQQALPYLRQIALAIAKDPYAGQYSLVAVKGPTVAQLRLALEELAREPMREDERSKQRLSLEQRLEQLQVKERQNREIFKQDVRRFCALMQSFFDRLEHYLPVSVGGKAKEPQLPMGVLFADDPVLRMSDVPAAATAVSLKLKGSLRFKLGGYDLAIVEEGGERALYVNDKDYLLRPRLKISVGDHRLFAFMEGDYLHLKLQDAARSLAVRVAEALAMMHVLSSSHSSELIEVLKLAGNTSLGDPQQLVLSAIERLRELSSRAPSRRLALEGLLRGAAQAQGIDLPENLIMSVVQRFYSAMTVSADDFSLLLEGADHSEAFIGELGDEPLSLTLAGQSLTIRRYRGRESDEESLVVLMPGRIIGSFDYLMLQTIPGGSLLCVRSRNELAILFFANIVVVS